MNFLKKINKGLVLTIIVVLVLVIYLTGVEKQRKSEKIEIKKVCESFIEFTDKYTVLPEGEKKLKNELTKEDEEKAEKELRTQLEKRMIKNNDAVEIQYSHLLTMLQNGYNSNQVKVKEKRTISKITGYEFDGDQVTVTFNSTVETNYKYIDEGTGKEMERQESNSYNGEEIILQKIDNQWKVVYSMIYDDDHLTYMNTMKMY